MSNFWINYQVAAAKYAVYEDPLYPKLAVIEECGELVGKFAKAMRGDRELDRELDREGVLKEIGDILWNIAVALYDNGQEIRIPALTLREIKDGRKELAPYEAALAVPAFLFKGNTADSLRALVMLAILMDTSLQECAEMNLAKLASRKKRGVIKGDGDNR